MKELIYTINRYSPEIDSFIIAKLSVCHVSMVTDNLPDVLWRHVLFLGLNKTKLSLLTVTFRLKLLPFPSCRDTKGKIL